MATNSPNRDRIPTDPKTILLIALTCINVAIALVCNQTQSLSGLLPIVFQLLPDRRR